MINLDLISRPEIEGEFFFLDLVSKLEIKCQKILVSSRYARLNRRNSHSRLEVEKVTLVDLWYNALAGEVVGCWVLRQVIKVGEWKEEALAGCCTSRTHQVGGVTFSWISFMFLYLFFYFCVFLYWMSYFEDSPVEWRAFMKIKTQTIISSMAKTSTTPQHFT